MAPNSTNNLLSYFGLIKPRMSDSDKEYPVQSNVIMYALVGKNVIILLLIIPIPIIVMLTILKSFVEQMGSPMTVFKVRKFQEISGNFILNFFQFFLFNPF